MQIFKIDTNLDFYTTEIKGDLKSLQEEVGGYITTATYWKELREKDIDIYANDEGLFADNPTITLIITDERNEYKVVGTLVGNLIFASHDDEGNTIGLTNEQIEFVVKHLVPVTYSNSTQRKKAYAFRF